MPKPVEVLLKPKPSPRIIEALEMLLQDAKEGKVRGIAMCWVSHEDHGIDCQRVFAGSGWFSALIGGIEILKHDMAREVLNDNS